MQLGYGTLMLSGEKSKNKEIEEIKNYCVRLTNELRYVLQNIDEDNLSDGLNSALSEEVKTLISANDMQIKGNQSAINALSSAVLALSSRVAELETQTEEFELTLSAGVTQSVSFENEYEDIPNITVLKTSAEDGGITSVASVSETGCTVTSTTNSTIILRVEGK